MELIILLVGLLGLAYALYLFWSIMKIEVKSERMKEIAGAINAGAMTYLKRQYLSLSVFMAIVFIAIFVIATAELQRGGSEREAISK